MAEVKNHPLMFTFRDVISGNGFLVGITLSGRALMVQEDGKWWMYGVRPAAIAESGEGPQETFMVFRNRFKEVLFDIASESKTYEHFKAEVERFFYEPDFEEERKWEEAVSITRDQSLTFPPAPFTKLPIESPEDRPSQITVERLDGESKRFMPSDNVTENYHYMALAA